MVHVVLCVWGVMAGGIGYTVWDTILGKYGMRTRVGLGVLGIGHNALESDAGCVM